MRIVFMGTPQFAVPTLQKLYESEHDVIAVVTKPDGRRDRGQKLTYPPVKELALQKRTKILQPQKVKGNGDLYETLLQMKPDAFVVVAYGKILPKNILKIPKFGCINIHGSLLPKYRGAAPIHWSLVHGEKYTGVTTMLMDEGMDTGDILLKKELKILDEDNVDTLHKKLAILGAELLIETLKGIEGGTVSPIKQNDMEASYAPMVTKEMGMLNWNLSAIEVHNKIKGFNPWPGTFTYLYGERIKILDSQIYNQDNINTESGTIVDIVKEGIVVKTGDGTILIKTVQPPNKGKMDAYSYVNGYKIKRGIRFEQLS